MIAYPILKNGYNVFHLSLEQAPTRVYSLYLARHILEQHGTIKNMSDGDLMKSKYEPKYEGLVQEGYISLQGEGMGKLLIEGRSLKATELILLGRLMYYFKKSPQVLRNRWLKFRFNWNE